MEAGAEAETAEPGWAVDAAGAWAGSERGSVESKSFEAAGVTALTGLVGLDGEGSVLPSRVRFFLRNPPREGIDMVE